MQNAKATIVVDGTKYIREDLAPIDNRPITERVKSYEDACAVLGIHPTELNISVAGYGDGLSESIKAYGKLIVIAQALNEGWTPDWGNNNEYKYYPWFKANPSGSGLSYRDFAFWNTVSFVPARLCFKTAELAEYAGKQFIDLYTDYIK